MPCETTEFISKLYDKLEKQTPKTWNENMQAAPAVIEAMRGKDTEAMKSVPEFLEFVHHLAALTHCGNPAVMHNSLEYACERAAWHSDEEKTNFARRYLNVIC